MREKLNERLTINNYKEKKKLAHSFSLSNKLIKFISKKIEKKKFINSVSRGKESLLLRYNKCKSILYDKNYFLFY